MLLKEQRVEDKKEQNGNGEKIHGCLFSVLLGQTFDLHKELEIFI